ncbi:PepSY domain-containing protein [Silvanigrella aquatica]|uniref:FTP domain-containing protein n=1 Tax=Silvanigrella aquatica TaxID=1915309 RepID=A0A1L4D0J3_9BACT|nr:PepSY domain-containing protein [Silvanigrella aquatica]APJ03723.1 hypothetical protein AXG55_07305 [Silvanigrella aquatica]
MYLTKTSLKVVSFSLSAIVTLSASAGSNQKPNDLKRMLTIGVSQNPELQQKSDGFYRPDGSAAVITEPNYKSKKDFKFNEDFEKTSIEIAKEYLRENANKFGLDKNSISELALISVRKNEGFNVVRFEQRSQGVPVYGSSIAITVTNKGRVSYVASNSITGIVNTNYQLNYLQYIEKEQAIEFAKNHLGNKDIKINESKFMIYKNANGEITQVWKINLISNSTPKGDWEILVDANNGNILRAEEKQFHAYGTAKVYKVDPLSSTRHKNGDSGYVDNKLNPNSSDTTQSSTDSPELTAARIDVNLKEISLNNGKYSLSSSYAECQDFESPKDAACPVQSNSDFTFTRTSKYFDAVNAYYDIDTYMRYVNETLGINVMPYKYKGGVRFDPHAVNGDDNSYYSSFTGALSFGQGGIDDAEDVMVVIHELGHGIHDWITHGHSGNDSRDGIGEGTGDYLAAGYVRDQQENKWLPSDEQYNWVMRWDGHNLFWPGRVSNWNVGRKYPDNVVNTGDSHKSGQYWSSCNIAARDKLGGKLMDKAFLNGLSKTIETATQVSAAQAIIDAARDMDYTQEQINMIGDAYNKECTYGVKIPHHNSDEEAL